MATTISTQDIIDAKRDIEDIGEAVNEVKIVSPRYGEDFKSIPMISAEGQAAISTFESNGQSSINSFDTTAQNTISEWEAAISLITQEGGIPALAVSDASGKNQQEINNSFFNLGFTNVKDYGAKGDGVTDDTLALMNACADFHTGVLYFPPGKYLINYDTINPHFSEKIPAGITNSKVMRAICFFGLKNAVISGYGAEIFVRDQAKTVLAYDATFGILQSIGNIENVYIQGLTFNGNAFNQPYAGVGD